MPNVLNMKKICSWDGVAGAALTKYRGVVLNYETGTVNFPSAQGDLCDGVIVVNAASGEVVEVVTDGIVPVVIKTAGSIVKGDLLMVATDGGFLEATSTEVAIAQALMPASQNGDIILAKLIRPTVIA